MSDPRPSFALLALLLGAFLAGCGDSDDAQSSACAGKDLTPGQREIRIESGGRERRFLLVVPEAAQNGEPLPLVLGYHGVTSTPEIFLAVTEFPAKAEAEGFVVAAGAGVERSWNAGACCAPATTLDVDDVGFTRDMIAAIEEESCIDSSRIFATGFSNGGAMTFRLACEPVAELAATAPVAGGIASRCEPGDFRSILVVQNVEDPVVPFVLGELAFDQFTGINQCSAERTQNEPAGNAICDIAPSCGDETTVELCAVSGLSHVWPGGATNPEGPYRATDEIWSFFAAQP